MSVVTLQYAPSLGGFDERPLAELVRDKAVLAVREHFFTVHDLPHLACLVTWQEAPASGDVGGGNTGSRGAQRKPDLVADLPPEQRPLFETLREWRAKRARKDGVPPYVVFTNRELIEILRARPATRTALGSVEGVGAGKVERYGDALLGLVGPPPESKEGGA